MRNKVLIVDDVEINRAILGSILEQDYTIIEAEDGEQALMQIAEYKEELACILMDIVMPRMNGKQVLAELGRQKLVSRIPVLVISGDHDFETEKECFDLGASDYIAKPFNNAIVQKRVKNTIALYDYKLDLEKKVEGQTGILRKAYQTLKTQAERLQKNNQQIIDMLGTVVEFRNLESGEHINRVKKYTQILAEEVMHLYPEYGLTRDRIGSIVAASSLHDVGKITIPDSILLKPGRLTKDEFDYMKSHTVRGCELLEHIDVDWESGLRQDIYDICRYHHERYDGKGYPDGLVGEEIPISAQLVSIADVYDALVNERCYKDAYSAEEAYRMIMQGECGVFSPKLLEAFRRCRKAFEILKTLQRK